MTDNNPLGIRVFRRMRMEGILPVDTVYWDIDAKKMHRNHQPIMVEVLSGGLSPIEGRLFESCDPKLLRKIHQTDGKWNCTRILCGLEHGRQLLQNFNLSFLENIQIEVDYSNLSKPELYPYWRDVLPKTNVRSIEFIARDNNKVLPKECAELLMYCPFITSLFLTMDCQISKKIWTNQVLPSCLLLNRIEPDCKRELIIPPHRQHRNWHRFVALYSRYQSTIRLPDEEWIRLLDCL